LIKAGALDAFGERGLFLENLDTLLVYAKGAERETTQRQTNLFGMLPTTHAPKLTLKPAPPAQKAQRLTWERELLGLYRSEHPLSEFRAQLEAISTPIAKLALAPRSQSVAVAGVVTQIQKILTRKGENMLFVKVEDLTGSIEVLVFPKLLRQSNDVWSEEAIVLVKGKLSDKDGIPKLLADSASIFDLNSVRLAETERVCTIPLPNGITPDRIEELKAVFANFPGETRVHLSMPSPTPRTMATNFYVEDSPDFRTKVRSLLETASL
jgi:DNA polymerase-3 subunit alpha